MKKQDEEGKQVIAGNIGSNYDNVSSIKEVIYGEGITMDEKKAKQKADKAKRLDEGR